jgi:hypothetical protein
LILLFFFLNWIHSNIFFDKKYFQGKGNWGKCKSVFCDCLQQLKSIKKIVCSVPNKRNEQICMRFSNFWHNW